MIATERRASDGNWRANMRGGKGTVKVEHWFKPEAFSAKARLCARLTIEPGGSIGSHTHDGEDEIYLVLSGNGLIEEQGEWVPIQAGDAILTGKGASHGVENTGSERWSSPPSSCRSPEPAAFFQSSRHGVASMKLLPAPCSCLSRRSPPKVPRCASPHWPPNSARVA